MSKQKNTPPKSSSAEYLTFIASAGDSEEAEEMRYEDENIWLTQKLMAEIYDVSVPAINQHLKRLIADSEIDESSAIKKVTDIYATSIDYDTSAATTKRFFAAVQNKLHYAIHGNTAAEVIVDRADHQKKNMGLTTWDGAPKDKILKYDVSIAKNYLSDAKLEQLQRIVSAYLDMAELQAMRKIPMTMADWETRLNGFLQLFDREVLQDAGRVTAELVKQHAESEFEKYRIVQDRLHKSDFDRFLELTEKAEKLEEQQDREENEEF